MCIEMHRKDVGKRYPECISLEGDIFSATSSTTLSGRKESTLEANSNKARHNPIRSSDHIADFF